MKRSEMLSKIGDLLENELWDSNSEPNFPNSDELSIKVLKLIEEHGMSPPSYEDKVYDLENEEVTIFYRDMWEPENA